jgi:hypothetical protein
MKMLLAAAAITAAAIWSVAPAASAAEIKATPCLSEANKDDAKCAVIAIRGIIKPEDGDVFVKLVADRGITKGAIDLNSDGGNVGAALKIGREVRRVGFNTSVDDQVTCASACGLIWLAGKTRWYDNRSRIGFHAPYYLVESKSGRRSSTVNLPATGGAAVVGAYLAEMGLNEDAIFQLTARNGDLLWLTVGIAKKLGIGNIVNTTEDAQARRIERIAREAAEKVAREAAEKVAREIAKKLDDEQQKRIVPLLATGTCPEGSAIEPFNRTYCVKDKT